MTRTSRFTGRARGGFTLVEMLVVIVIIGILAALIIPAVQRSIIFAREAALKAELKQLEQAIETYKLKTGDYPPDWSNPTVVTRHFKKIFPRSVENPPAGLTKAQALVFCLQGYSPDVVRPFTGTGKQSFYDFDQTRLVSDPAGGAGSYLVFRPKDLTAPYVYFDARTYGSSTYAATGMGTVSPYKLDGTNFQQPKTFQVLSAGLDDNYGNGGWLIFPTAIAPGSPDADNVANFNEKATLGGDIP